MIPLAFDEVSNDRRQARLAVVLFFEDDPELAGAAADFDRRLGGALATLLDEGRIGGRVGERLLVRSRGFLPAEWILFTGAGLRQGQSPEAFRGFLVHLVRVVDRLGFTPAALILEPIPGIPVEVSRRLVAEILADEEVAAKKSAAAVGREVASS